MNRRNLLQAASIVGASSVGIGAVGATDTGTSALNIRDSEELDRQERVAAVRYLFSKYETRVLVREFHNHGWYLAFEDGSYKRIKPSDGENYRTVVIPMYNRSTTTENIHTHLLWDEQEGKVKVSVVEASGNPDGEGNEVRERTYSYTGDRIHVGSTSLEEFRDTDSDTSVDTQDETNDGSGDAPECVDIYERCQDWNMTCIFAIAATVGGCGITGGFWCVMGLGAAALQYADDEGCNLCDKKSKHFRPLCK